MSGFAGKIVLYSGVVMGGMSVIDKFVYPFGMEIYFPLFISIAGILIIVGSTLLIVDLIEKKREILQAFEEYGCGAYKEEIIENTKKFLSRY